MTDEEKKEIEETKRWKMMSEIESKYNTKLLENIEDIKTALQYYMSENQRLHKELDYYKNAYENRVNEYIKITNRVGRSTSE